MHYTVGPSFGLLVVINGYVITFGHLSVFQTYCSSQLIIDSNLFEVDILGLADLAGDIFMRKKALDVYRDSSHIFQPTVSSVLYR